MIIKRRISPIKTLHRACKKASSLYIALISRKASQRWLIIFGLAALFLSTVYWSLLGADIHRGNADQLVDGYLFESLKTFTGAQFPGAHTFLLKWPLFALLPLFNFSLSGFAFLTVLMTIATVGILAWILYKIDRRPLVFTAFCLGLACIFLMIPAQPHDNALLPVNMAMITTRNLEYAVYLAALYVIMRRPLKSWGVATSFVGLTLLFASDKLFAVLAVGSGLLAYILFRLAVQVRLTVASLQWLAVSLVAAVAANGLLWAINAVGLTNIVSEASASPFALTHEPRNIALGIIFGLGSLLTNFGANPVYDLAVLKELPRLLLDRLQHPSSIVFLANFSAFAAAVFATCKVLLLGIRSRANQLTPDVGMAVLLTLATVTAGGAYVFTDHYHPVDARYLFIGFFALVISLAVYVRSLKKLPRGLLAGLILIGAVILPLAVLHAHDSHARAARLFAERDDRNKIIARVITDTRTNVLVGDYWSVIPIRQYLPANYHLTIVPQGDCKTPYPVLNSEAWRADLRNTRFLYLARQTKLDQKGVYNNCELKDIIKTYGAPNANYVLAGSTANPSEMLFLYQQGIRSSRPVEDPKDAVLPRPPERLRNTTCQTGTILNVVAHEDDDLLFINPDTKQAINAEKCVRTVFVTSGDAGGEAKYWKGRELGARAAYAAMAGKKDVWGERVIRFGDRYITVATLEDNPNISLLFMHLPDGNLRGQGFRRAGHRVSLELLEKGRIETITALDSESTYTRSDLTNVLTDIMRLYSPTEVRTQNPTKDPAVFDHSDHIAVGRLTRLAYEQYHTEKPESAIAYYMGYPISDLEPNLSTEDILDKQRTFLIYGIFDGAACRTMDECRHTAYEPFLQRQYKMDAK